MLCFLVRGAQIPINMIDNSHECDGMETDQSERIISATETESVRTYDL